MKLVIVESPTKAKTLSKILGKEYDIKASMGHIRDLPKSGIGIDIEHNFAPEYVVPDKAKKALTDLKKSAKETDLIILATDPDREGEAIAWHLKELLSTKGKGKSKASKDTESMKFERVVFHELTKEAIEEAFEHRGKLDMNLVDAQQARRVLDRLVGYKLSPLLWKKVQFGLSAGRVQSVAVRLVVERERERDAFKPEEYWSGLADFETSSTEVFQAEIVKKDGKKLEIKNAKQAKEIEDALKKKDVTFVVSEVKKTEKKRAANPPLKTSTLQQSAANLYGMSAKKTMFAAQKLFEKGLITYHRTDSLNLSSQFINTARNFIKSEYGANYLPEQGIMYKTKSANAQEAHEAIRPTVLDPFPSSAAAGDEKKIYSLIYKRALESQMNSAVYDQTSISVLSSNNYMFRASGSVILFDGWLAVGKKLGMHEKEDMNVLPDAKEKDLVDLKKLIMEQHFTQPPARYSDASLIKALEEKGIGRPSTYAPTLGTITARGYVERDGRYFVPRDVAYVVTDLLVKHFPEIVDYEFTAGMEEDLDKIANAEKEWVPVIREFYAPFEKTLDKKDKELNKHDVTNLGEVGEKCPECGKELLYKLGKFGKFISCSNYPTCEYARPLEENTVKDENGKEITDFGKCEICSDGVYILKTGRYGKFLACSNYPKCKTTKPFLEKIGMKCPKCSDGDVVLKKAKGRPFYGCSKYPDCDFSSWKNPLEKGKEETESTETVSN